MIGRAIDNAVKPIAKLLQYDYMEGLGINNTMKIARAYHYLKYGKYHEYRKAQCLHHFDELIRENGMPVSSLKEIKDVWFIDTSETLPLFFFKQKTAYEIIRERGGIKRQGSSRPY